MKPLSTELTSQLRGVPASKLIRISVSRIDNIYHLLHYQIWPNIGEMVWRDLKEKSRGLC